MELTRDKIEWLAKQPIISEFAKIRTEEVVDIAKQLLAEMDNPKVWDNAPDNAIIAKVHFYKRDKVYARPDGMPEVYTRTIPKSPERLIAERRSKVIVSTQMTERELIADQIEAAINEYKESVK